MADRPVIHRLRVGYSVGRGEADAVGLGGGIPVPGDGRRNPQAPFPVNLLIFEGQTGLRGVDVVDASTLLSAGGRRPSPLQEMPVQVAVAVFLDTPRRAFL